VPSRFLIGIDLGTTNSVVAYIDTAASREPGATGAGTGSAVRVFPVPQLVAHGEVRTLSALPSFLYFPTAGEVSTGAVSATWDEDPPMVTGLLAREQGALVPARQVSSAKSWLSYSGANRRAKILPSQAEPPQPMISPVDASARYLMHLRDAWNAALGTTPDTRFERQEIVLTVPASFDEEARELTVEAARAAGLIHLTLLEEPLAAFYSWMEARAPAAGAASVAAYPTAPAAGGDELRDGELVLICDIGGGTTDFSLVRANAANGELQFERTAIGEHLLLGGDNLDFALARHLEVKLETPEKLEKPDEVEQPNKLPGVTLSLRQRYALRRACCAAKEQLLGDSPPERLPVTILGSGRSVIGQALSVDLARDEVLQILTTGFLPLTAPDEMPSRGRATGLRELGLTYASDPAITRHLAAFLTQAAVAMASSHGATMSSSSPGQPMARPDAVLFNGGFCVPAVTRERIIQAISAWFDGWRPRLLNSQQAESAVARGAACYGRVRRGTGSRVRVGSARTYYIGLSPDDARADRGLQAICILPAGVEQGATLPLLDREFSVLANRPVSFTLYSSRTRRDAHGEVVLLDPADAHRHAPLVSLLRYGKKMRELYLTVRLRANYTEVGTLELWFESHQSAHRWRLQFELRGHDLPDNDSPENESPDNDVRDNDVRDNDVRDNDVPSDGLPSEGSPASPPTPDAHAPSHSPTVAVSEAAVETGAQLIRDVFSSSAGSAPETLLSRLESTLGAKRDSWSTPLLRRFSDVLLEVSSARKLSSRHELRWLNLLGFCLRPGFGAPGDDVRISQLWTALSTQLVFADDLQCRIELLVLLRRISGGINASKQQALYREHTAAGKTQKGAAAKKKPRPNRQLDYDSSRLLASLEHLPSTFRASLGRQLLAKLRAEPGDAIWLWSLGRLGARIPLYGPLHSVVAPAIAAEWLQVLLDLSPFTAAAAHAVAAIARRAGDSSRDLDEAIRVQAIARLTALGAESETIQLLSSCVAPQRNDAARAFGETLPPGLQLVSSSNCLLSVPAFAQR
jgi:molecular chaperone DnaK (HSP70)